MKTTRRAMLYLRRKKTRTALLFLLLFALSLSLAVGVTVWGSVGAAVHDVERSLGTSFIVKMPDNMTAGPFEMLELKDGTTERTYVGPRVDQQLVDQIMQVGGISSYQAENFTYACVDADEINLIAGAWMTGLERQLETLREDPDWEEKKPGHMLSIDVYKISRLMTAIYASSNTELFSYFRTGAFSLIDGRHVTPQDDHKVMISDRLAEKNGLGVGDKLTLRTRDWKNETVIGGSEVEIVGIFCVNGYQPINEFVFENDITYNWILSDFETYLELWNVSDQNYYLNYEKSLYYDSVTFFVEDAERLDEIMAEVQDLDVMDPAYYTAVRDDTMYKSTVDPLNSISMMVLIVVSAIAIGCFIVLCIVFTMWIRSRRKEVAIYLSLGFRKAKILGQFITEAAVVAVAASVVAFAVCQPIAGAIGNSMLSSVVAEAAPEEKMYTEEELYELAVSGGEEAFALDSGTYAGPEQIDFTFGFTELLIIVGLELLVIIGAVCKGGSFIFALSPRQILTTLS